MDGRQHTFTEQQQKHNQQQQILNDRLLSDLCELYKRKQQQQIKYKIQNTKIEQWLRLVNKKLWNDSIRL